MKTSIVIAAMTWVLLAGATAHADSGGLAPEFSGDINQVVKLTEAGLDPSVVISYIKASPGPFQPSADEIIKLRDDGVSTEIINAMLARGAELQQQDAAGQNPSASASSQPAPAYVQTVYEDADFYYYIPPASTVVYIGGTYGYPSLNYCSSPVYGAYYSPPVAFYGGSIYGGCYPRVGVRVGFGAPFGGFHGGFHGGLHGGYHGGWHR